MKFYVAAPWQLLENARDLRRILLAAKMPLLECTARWLDEQADTQATRAHAEMDLEDVKAADVVVFLNPWQFKTSGTGGRHVEVGYALAHGKPILLVGEKSNLFHELPLVEIVREGPHLFDRLYDHYRRVHQI